MCACVCVCVCMCVRACMCAHLYVYDFDSVWWHQHNKQTMLHFFAYDPRNLKLDHTDNCGSALLLSMEADETKSLHDLKVILIHSHKYRHVTSLNGKILTSSSADSMTSKSQSFPIFACLASCVGSRHLWVSCCWLCTSTV
jgi:hypothetical protein